MHSKDELHHWDELKQNQRTRLEDLLDQQWSPRGDTFTQPGEADLLAPHWAHNATRLHGTGEPTEKPGSVERKDSDGLLLSSTEGNWDKGTQTHSISTPATQHPPAKFRPSEESISERAWSRIRPTKEPNPEPRRNNETPEERILQTEEENLKEERKELLLLHKRLDQEKETLRQQKEKEADGRHRLHQHQTTTHKPGI